MNHSSARAARLAFVPMALMALVVGAFVVDTVVDIRADDALSSEVDDISANDMPSVTYLTRARGVLRRMESDMDEFGAASEQAEPPPNDWGVMRQQFDAALRGARAVKPMRPESDHGLSGERALYGEVTSARRAFDRASSELLAATAARDERAAHASLTLVHRTGARLDSALEHVVVYDARQGERLGNEVAHLRTRLAARTLVVDVALGVLAMAATIAAAVAWRHEVAALQERTSELDMFAGRVAHDLTSPLQTVGLGLDLARKELAGNDRGALAVERSARSLERVRGLVDGLLALARGGASDTTPAATDLNDAIRGVLDGIATQAHEAGVELRLEAGPDYRVACPPGVITSLTQNLVGNAIKHMGDSPLRVVTVRTRDVGRRARVEVEDTGPGVPEAIRGRLFEPFVRGTQAVPGVGLGLATVKKLALARGGAVGCDSKPGGGSRFWFELPRSET